MSPPDQQGHEAGIITATFAQYLALLGAERVEYTRGRGPLRR